VTVHDGFTLADLVSYDDKHNQANGEDNRDGTNDNRSWNCGIEGPSGDPEVVTLRGRQSRALLTTLLLSFGVPLVLGGDELGRTQQGNNNAYCQDNATTWFDWSHIDQDLLGFAKQLVAFRRAHPVFRRGRFLAGAEASELQWFRPSGIPMATADWSNPDARSVAIFLDGVDDPDRASDGRPLLDDDFLLLVNSWWQSLDFTIPEIGGRRWHRQIDTFEPGGPSSPNLSGGDNSSVGPRSIVVLSSSRA
jgi:glycogen operon protein